MIEGWKRPDYGHGSAGCQGDVSARIGAVSQADPFNAAAFFVDRHVAEERGPRPVFRVTGTSVSYAELAERVNRAGHVLAALGVEIEHRVVLVLYDTPTFAAAFWGALKPARAHARHHAGRVAAHRRHVLAGRRRLLLLRRPF